MIVDGRQIAKDIKERLREQIEKLGREISLAVVQVGHTPAMEKFVAQKRRFGDAIGVLVRVYNFPEGAAEEDLISFVEKISADVKNSGVIVQLPLPKHINANILLKSIPPRKDVDALGVHPLVLSPVVGAVKEILKRNDVEVRGRRVAVVGCGRLVGKPVAEWLKSMGVATDIIDEDTPDPKQLVSDADVVISGVGKPGIITSDYVKKGAVLIDAGTSEAGGKLVGDIDPACAENAAIYTPVPGGVGPITVAILFRNLVELARV